MPMRITAPDGTVLYIRTHVGDGLSVIEIWEESHPAPDEPLEPSGDDTQP